MPFDLWLTFTAASFVLLVVPGPTILMVLSYALTQGRRVAIASALGVAAGDLVAMTVSVIGLGALFLTSALAFTVLKWVGALYLIYLGLRMLISKPAGPASLLNQPEQQPARKVFRDLLTVTALNPKSNTFFVAFVPQFIQPDLAYGPQAGILVATFVSVAGFNALVFAIGANAMRQRITRPKVLTWLNRAGGATLVGMGLLTASLRRAT